MRSGRVRVLALSFLLAVVIVAGWLVGIAPQLADASRATASRAAVLVQNASNESVLRKLKNDYMGIEGIRNQLSVLRVSVPVNADISTFVTELNTLANAYKVTVRSITINDAKPYTPVAPAAANNAAGSTTPPTTNTRITSENFIVIPVQFSVSGDYSSVLEFVHKVQVGARLFLISTLSSTGTTDAKAVSARDMGSNTLQKVDATVGGYVYVLINGTK